MSSAKYLTELCHSKSNRVVKWEGVQVDYGRGKECVLVVDLNAGICKLEGGCALTAWY